jgi:aerobic carbon-monoxide dehydrogenase medium subunit
MAPGSLDEALALRAEHGDDATVLAGGTFLGILMNQGLLSPTALLSLARVPELAGIDVRGDELRLGAMTTHTAVERSPVVRERWPVLARAFRLVASPRVRNQATVGGVLADADYASDPPAVFAALGARAVLRSARGERSVGIDELIRGYYETCIEPDELLVEVVVPAAPRARRRIGRAWRSPPSATASGSAWSSERSPRCRSTSPMSARWPTAARSSRTCAPRSLAATASGSRR